MLFFFTHPTCNLFNISLFDKHSPILPAAILKKYLHVVTNRVTSLYLPVSFSFLLPLQIVHSKTVFRNLGKIFSFLFP
jgi:hypothetical protein